MIKYFKEVRILTELLSPCGGKKELKAAVYAGANAVYLGVSKFNARQSADNFSLEDIPKYNYLRQRI